MQGEDQKKLDIVANEVFINVLRRSGQCSVLVGPLHLSILSLGRLHNKALFTLLSSQGSDLHASLTAVCMIGSLRISAPDEAVQVANPFNVIFDRFLKRLTRRSS